MQANRKGATFKRFCGRWGEGRIIFNLRFRIIDQGISFGCPCFNSRPDKFFVNAREGCYKQPLPQWSKPWLTPS
jgi:hypothetical protein